MTMMLKKILIATLGIFLFVANPIKAEKNIIKYNKPEVEKSCKSCCTPSCYQKTCDNKKNFELLLREDFLCWKGSVGGIDCAYGDASIVENTNTQITTVEQSDINPHFKWNAGLKVGLNALFDCFDVGALWTHYHGYATYKDYNKCGDWKLKYDTFDLTLGYDFYPCAKFGIKPFVGLRVANIHHGLESHLEALKTTISETTEREIIKTDINNKEKFHGAGPEVGAEARWYIDEHFSFYCMCGAVAYYGSVYGEYYNENTFEASKNTGNLTKHYWFNNIGTDATIGIRFDKYMCNNSKNLDGHIMVKLGLEEHRIYNFGKLRSYGNLNLAGGTLEIGIGFRF